MTNITVTSPNADAELAKLNRKIEKAGQLEIAHKKLSIFLDRWVQKNFKTVGDNVGGWKPFKTYCIGGARSPYGLPRQCARGRVIGKGASRRIDKSAKLLQDTGRLRISFKPYYSKAVAGIGSEIPYSKPHQEGLGHLPQRRMLPIDREVNGEIRAVYEQHLRNWLK